MKMTGFFHHHLMQQNYKNSLLKSGKTRRWRRQAINILGPKDSPSLNFLQSNHKQCLFKVKSQIFKIGRFYSTYRDSDFSRGTNWSQYLRKIFFTLSPRIQTNKQPNCFGFWAIWVTGLIWAQPHHLLGPSC